MNKNNPDDVEKLAHHIHESAREAVAQNKVVAKINAPFKGWDEITDDAREGRRMMARYLLEHYEIKALPPPRPKDPPGTMECPRRIETGGMRFPHEDQGPTPDRWREDNTCSYCGSLNPDEVLRRIKAGEEVGPTDKSYKLYIGKSGGDKAYFQHFDEKQGREFVELYNNRTMRIGLPGHFYVRPMIFAPRKPEG